MDKSLGRGRRRDRRQEIRIDCPLCLDAASLLGVLRSEICTGGEFLRGAKKDTGTLARLVDPAGPARAQFCLNVV